MWMWRPGEGGSLQSIVSAEVHVQFKNCITFLAKRHNTVIFLDIWVALKGPFVSKAYLTSAMGSVATVFQINCQLARVKNVPLNMFYYPIVSSWDQ